jgi:GntR family transcriptional regulator, transcriptional repressor for pyruvate dehydrogenase complex
MIRPSHPLRRPVEDGRELHAVVTILETLAVRMAPPRSAAALDALRAANGRLATAGDDPCAAAAAGAEFHALLSDACGDERLLELLATAREGLSRARRVHRVDGRAIPRAIREHAAIIDALAAGDADRAADRLRAHLTRRRPRG